MKKPLMLFPLAILCLTSCGTLHEMTYLIDQSTDAITYNRYAVEQSTEVINENTAIIDASTKTVEENRRLLEAVSN